MTRHQVVVAVAVSAALLAALLVDVLLSVSPPGRMAAFSLGAALALSLAAKAWGRCVVSRPEGTRPGEAHREDRARG